MSNSRFKPVLVCLFAYLVLGMLTAMSLPVSKETRSINTQGAAF